MLWKVFLDSISFLKLSGNSTKQRFAKKIHFGKDVRFYFRQNWTAVTIPGLIFCINMSISYWNTITHSLVLPNTQAGRQAVLPLRWQIRASHMEQAASCWARLTTAEQLGLYWNDSLQFFFFFTRFSKTCFFCSLPPSSFFTVLSPPSSLPDRWNEGLASHI